jgi:hypothetical protein
MIKMRLVFAAEVVFVYMVDGQRKPFRGMKFPADYKSIAAVAESWKSVLRASERFRLWWVRIFMSLWRSGL